VERNLTMCALVIAAVGAAMDVRSRRIPNWFTGGGMLAGLVFQTSLAGWRGFEASLTGALVGGGVLFLVFLVRGMGAGDVKLMATVGAWVGIRHAAVLVFATAIAGGIMAVGYATYYKQVARTARNLRELIRFHLAGGAQAHPDFHLQGSSSIRLPYGVAIAAGALYSFLSTAGYWRR
jgi:prepilin peptidase CpaA